MTAHEVSGDLVLTERRGAVGVVTINRPDKYNAISPGVVDGLEQAFTELWDDRGIRAVVLTGSGRAFAAGADITFYATADHTDFAAYTKRCNDLCDRIASAPVPVVAAVTGVALGGGFELALSCDVIVAEHDASFGLPEVALGLMPGWGGTQRLTRLIGLNRAKWMIMSGERLTAAAAAELGIVTRTCERENLLPVAVQLADTLADQAPLAISAIREAVTAAVTGDAGFRLEQERLATLFDSHDGREGIDAFVHKRPARFSGR